MTSTERRISTGKVISALREARERTLALVADLTDEQLLGPRLGIVNPLRWELGHVAWFQEFWMLRHLRGAPPILTHGDSLYDSARVSHDTRWDLSLLSRGQTLDYARTVLERVIEQSRSSDGRLKAPDGYDEAYFLQLVLFHEQMHAEAFTYTRQTLAYPPPSMATEKQAVSLAGNNDDSLQVNGLSCGDAEIPGGKFILGSRPDKGFAFDNEYRAHKVNLAPFAIARTAVTNAEFRGFVEDRGYQRRELWSAEGWLWRESAGAEYPVYWRPEANGRWQRRYFDQWLPLEDLLPVIHVNWYEAEAHCRWARRRLPTEAEWEMAASLESTQEGLKRKYPWGDVPPGAAHANLDWRGLKEGGCVAVDALPEGDSAFGCRQMIGNVWEWTATTFGPYPDFAPGPYKEYSQPWFGDHKVLRGGCWATRGRMIRNSYRNFYTPDRRDVWAGLRTCVL